MARIRQKHPQDKLGFIADWVMLGVSNKKRYRSGKNVPYRNGTISNSGRRAKRKKHHESKKKGGHMSLWGGFM